MGDHFYNVCTKREEGQLAPLLALCRMKTMLPLESKGGEKGLCKTESGGRLSGQRLGLVGGDGAGKPDC